MGPLRTPRPTASTKKLVNPVLFSQHFALAGGQLDAAGLFDPILNSDTKLFIDPLLLRTSSNAKVSSSGHDLLRQRFGDIIRLVDAAESRGDIAWRTAAKKLDLSERPETCLGYGGAGIGGSSRPETLKQQILTTAKEIVRLGEKDPEIISLMGLFEEGVGPDTISDLTTTLILPLLAEITRDFCAANGVPVRRFSAYGNLDLPENPYRSGTPVLLVPQDVVRDLPLANDWSDVAAVVFEISNIRDTFNAFVGDVTKATMTDKKRAIKQAALTSLDNFKQVFEAVLNGSTYYDPNEDILGFYAFRKLLASDLTSFQGKIAPPAAKTREELVRIVGEIIEHFRGLVEDNNLWEMLWDGNRPRKERAAQLLFFGVADAFCKANNVDISPETNPGGGPVDFKFSSGYDGRVLVEIKMSTGRVVHGYEKQLEIYKSASRTDLGYFLVIDVGGMGNKLDDIFAIRNARVTNDEMASIIEVVDASKKLSASKR